MMAKVLDLAKPRRIVQIDKLERRWAQIASPAGFFNSLLKKVNSISRSGVAARYMLAGADPGIGG